MKAMKGLTLSLLAFFIILASCEAPVRDNPSDKKSEEYDLEVSCDRAEGATVPVHEALVFTFSDTMVPSTLVVSGTANVTDADWSSAPWSESDLPGDTVTLNPRSLSTPGLWGDGAASTLTLQCSSVNGQTVTQSFTFTMVNDLDISTNTPEGAMVSAHEALSFTFKYDMVPGSLVVSGTGSISGADWTSADNWDADRKILTLDPRGLTTPGLWAEGAESTLTLEATSVNGQRVSQSFSYLIENAVYVSVDTVGATNENPGTISEPLQFIQVGINLADSLYETAVVRVAVGTYASNFASTSLPVADMKSGISLHGGYAKDFQTRDIGTYTCRLVDSGDSSTLTSSTWSDPSRVISFLQATTERSTVLDGFDIVLGVGENYNSGILIASASPTIRNCEVIGRAGRNSCGISISSGMPLITNITVFEVWEDPLVDSTACDHRGIFVMGSEEAEISNCRIWGGYSADQLSSTHGIFDLSDGTNIHDNVIIGSSGAIGGLYSYGIYIEKGSGSIISNNTIDLGIGKTGAVGIRIVSTGGSHPEINNNTFSNINYTANDGVCYAIMEGLANCDPTSVSYNDFDDSFVNGAPTVGIYYDFQNGQIRLLSTQINNDTYGSGSLHDWGNVSSF